MKGMVLRVEKVREQCLALHAGERANATTCAGASACEDSWAKPNTKGDKCSFCKELRGCVRVSDVQGLLYWICLRCDRLVNWH